MGFRLCIFASASNLRLAVPIATRVSWFDMWSETESLPNVANVGKVLWYDP
jgi:hypothetical protein